MPELNDLNLNRNIYKYGGYANFMKRDNIGRFLKNNHYSIKTEFKKGQHWRVHQPYWDKKYLIEEYITKGKSLSDIAKIHNCHTNNIWYFIKKHNIKFRSISESRKLKYWGLKGQDNPMFNKRGELHPNWKGGITPERQSFYISNEWKKACSFVWKRDNAQCQRFKIKENEGVPFHIHHIISFRNKELRADTTNLILLCEICHSWIHSKNNKNSEFLGGEKWN
jgi:hypothetical protein